MPRAWAGVGTLWVLGAMSVAAESQQELAAPHELHWNVRARTEVVDDDGYASRARAHTVRARLGYSWRPGGGLQAYTEGEHLEAFGNRYNSTGNGAVEYPVIADPEFTELNQAWFGWRSETFEGRAGRQRITFENQRYIGSVGWRQNEQTFDAVWMNWRPVAGLTLAYTYLDQVHRIHSDRAVAPLLRERDHDSHLLNVAFVPAAGHRLAGYVYALEDRDRPADSTATYGMRWTGRRPFAGWQLGWSLEAARQQDRSDHPEDFSLWYTLVEPRAVWGDLTWKVGREQLSGDGTAAYSTPLATLYAFNGWADRFLSTPADGLVNWYSGLDGKHGRFAWSLTWHDFRSDRGSDAYGREIDAGVSFAVSRRWPVVATLKVVDYRERGFASDTRKYVAQLEWKGTRG